MPKASVTRLIERDKAKLINFVLDIENIQNLFHSALTQKFMKKKKMMNL